MESYRVIDQEAMLGELDPKSHDIWSKRMSDSISFDVGEGRDMGVMSIYDVERGEYTFSSEVSEHSRDILRMLFGWSDEFKAQGIAFNRLLKTMDEYVGWCERFYSLARKGKQRKTTYRTIRRDCAKRNRRK